MSGDRAQALAVKVLGEVQAILAERESTHGGITGNMGVMAQVSAAVLGGRLDAPEEAAMRMVCGKLARWRGGDRAHGDHLRDAIGYLALVVGLTEAAAERER